MAGVRGNALAFRPGPHQSYDEEMLDPRVPKAPTPQWLQNTLNIPANTAALAANAVIDGYRGGKRMMTGQSTDPVADTLAATGAAGLIGVGLPARAAALGARTRPAAGFSVADLPAAEPRTAPKNAFRKQPTGTYYHGTDTDFAQYDPSKSSDGAMFLAPDRDSAYGFGGVVKEADVARGKYFDYRNPVDVERLKRDVSLSDKQRQMLEDGNFHLFSRDGGDSYSPVTVRQWLDKNNYDGWYENEGVGIDRGNSGPNLAVTRRGSVTDAKTGNTLFSSTKQASPASVFTAYHGSPHDFDKFSMDSIGTGEGAQTYGHGLYFAEAEDVAKNYSTMRNDHSFTLDGKEFSNSDPVAVAAMDAITNAGGKIDNAIKSLSESGDGLNKLGKDALDLLKSGRMDVKTSGNMYEVQINANKDDFLDWDKPLRSQPQNVKSIIDDKLRRYYGASGQFDAQYSKHAEQNPLMIFDEIDPRGMQSDIRSQEMLEAGIPGIRYLDGDSRGVGQGSSNYVLFDADLAEIKRKYAQAGIPLPPHLQQSEEFEQ